MNKGTFEARAADMGRHVEKLRKAQGELFSRECTQHVRLASGLMWMSTTKMVIRVLCGVVRELSSDATDEAYLELVEAHLIGMVDKIEGNLSDIILPLKVSVQVVQEMDDNFAEGVSWAINTIRATFLVMEANNEGSKSYERIV